MPDDPVFFAAVMGALLQLTYDDNWVQTTGITPQQASDLASTMFDECTESLGACMTGEVTMFAGATNPSGWLDCDGATYAESAYPQLYAAIDSAFISGTNFTVPDLRGRIPVGQGTGSGLSARAMAATGGEETHVITSAESAVHTHTDTGHVHSEGNAVPTAITIGPGAPAPAALPSVGFTGSGNASLTNSGSGGAHNNMQPFQVLRYIINAN